MRLADIHWTRFAPLATWTRRRRGVLDLLAVQRQRADLARLDDHRLNDLGIARSDAVAESARPVWDVPQHWRR